MSYSLLEWFSVISLILNFSRLLLIEAGLNRLKLIKATGWHKFNLSRLFSNPGSYHNNQRSSILTVFRQYGEKIGMQLCKRKINSLSQIVWGAVRKNYRGSPNRVREV